MRLFPFSRACCELQHGCSLKKGRNYSKGIVAIPILAKPGRKVNAHHTEKCYNLSKAKHAFLTKCRKKNCNFSQIRGTWVALRLSLKKHRAYFLYFLMKSLCNFQHLFCDSHRNFMPFFLPLAHSGAVRFSPTATDALGFIGFLSIYKGAAFAV